MKKFYVLLFVLTSLPCIAQKSSIQIHLMGGLAPGSSIVKQEGEYSIRSTPQPAFEVGIDYRHQINKSLSIMSGIRGTAIGYSALFNAPLKEVNPDYTEPFPPIKIKNYNLNISIPLTIEKNLEITRTDLIYFQAGARLHYSLGYESERVSNYFLDVDQNQIDVFGVELNTNNNNNPWVSASVGTGYGWLLKNLNILRLGLTADISFSKIVDGSYHVNIPGHPESFGKYSNKGSFFGLSTIYQFTGTKKQVTNRIKEERINSDTFKKETNHDDWKSAFIENNFSIHTAVLGCLPAKTAPMKGSYPINASVTPGVNAGFIYHININPYTGVNTGLEATLLQRNFNTRFNRSEYSPELKNSLVLNGKETNVKDLVISLPIAFEWRYNLSRNEFIQVEPGIRLNYSTGSDLEFQQVHGENINGENVKLAEIITYSNNDAAPWVSGLIKAGYNRMLKNKNIARLSMTSNISFTKYVAGNYNIYQNGIIISEGSYSSTGSYIGLSFSYMFVNTK